MFAYSSVAQIGYIILGLSFNSSTGLTASIVHLFNHGITKAAIFMLVGAAAISLGGASLAQINGMGRRMPVTTFALVLCGLSLIGVPGTAGFVSKWYLVLAALEKGQGWLVAMILLSSLLAVVYVWRFVEAAYFRAPPPGLPGRAEPRAALLAPALLMTAATIYFGIDTSFTVEGAARAAAALTGGLR